MSVAMPIGKVSTRPAVIRNVPPVRRPPSPELKKSRQEEGVCGSVTVPNKTSQIIGTCPVTRGRAFPYGCSRGAYGINFSILAPHATSVWLELQMPGDAAKVGDSSRMLHLDPSCNRTGLIWHMEVAASVCTSGMTYSWLLDPVLGKHGQPALDAVRVLDPCARALDTKNAESWNVRDSKKFAPRAMVPGFSAIENFDWEGVEAPSLKLKDLVIYETHIRSFTRHPDSGLCNQANGGTFLGFIEKIPHLLSLGINCVELLPLFEFDETACPRKHPKTGQDLCNYWGYSTAAYFVPMHRFASKSQQEFGAAIVEFKTLVRELHRYGIEVILDVVFNHTGEGAWGETNWHCLSAIAQSEYYLMIEGNHCNYTGCGNTVNANDPMCTEWIVECLRYWALEMRVDGFRFDLAAAMTRGSDGQIMQDPLFVRRLVNDPLLQHVKLIAEPWDCSWPDGYLVGRFPSGGQKLSRWAEWNGKYRDAVRCFIKGDEGMKGEFATRVCGSSDLYAENGRGPKHSINFVTAHDGFTLHDLVSYNKKHNSDNNEESGDDHNMSWNCGEEGPSKNPDVCILRARQMRNFMVALFLSAGTPMFTSGDEYGRSQNGNNNTWCQDALNWFSWKECAKQDAELVRFCSLIIAFRKRHGCIFERDAFYEDTDITWNHDNWDSSYNYISFILTFPDGSTPKQENSKAADDTTGDDAGAGTLGPLEHAPRRASILVAFNAGHIPHTCNLPSGREWRRIVDTNLVQPLDISESDEAAQLIGGESYVMTPYSSIVLKDFQDSDDAFTYGTSVDVAKITRELRAVAQRGLRDEVQTDVTKPDRPEENLLWPDATVYGA